MHAVHISTAVGGHFQIFRLKGHSFADEKIAAFSFLRIIANSGKFHVFGTTLNQQTFTLQQCFQLSALAYFAHIVLLG